MVFRDSTRKNNSEWYINNNQSWCKCIYLKNYFIKISQTKKFVLVKLLWRFVKIYRSECCCTCLCNSSWYSLLASCLPLLRTLSSGNCEISAGCCGCCHCCGGCWYDGAAAGAWAGGGRYDGCDGCCCWGGGWYWPPRGPAKPTPPGGIATPILMKSHKWEWESILLFVIRVGQDSQAEAPAMYEDNINPSSAEFLKIY